MSDETLPTLPAGSVFDWPDPADLVFDDAVRLLHDADESELRREWGLRGIIMHGKDRDIVRGHLLAALKDTANAVRFVAVTTLRDFALQDFKRDETIEVLDRFVKTERDHAVFSAAVCALRKLDPERLHPARRLPGKT